MLMRMLCVKCEQRPKRSHNGNTKYCGICYLEVKQRRSKTYVHSQALDRIRLMCDECKVRPRRSSHSSCRFCAECATLVTKSAPGRQIIGYVAKPMELSARDRMMPVLAKQVRPPVIQKDGWTINIAQHDAYFRDYLASFKRRRSSVHPDKGGTATQFRKLSRALRFWMQNEIKWYASVGLKPPIWSHRNV